MLELKDICKNYTNKKGKINNVLKNVSIKFESSGMTFVLGKSGSGKSTLLNLIGGLDNYVSGDMIILNKSTKNFKSKDFDNYRNNYIGFVFQEFNLIEDYTVIENIELALRLNNVRIDKDEIDKLLENLEIIEYKNRKLNELSGGQKQRVAIARALIKKPTIILADEPTGNLDSKTGIEVMELLKKISKDTLVIVVSHNRDFADEYGDRIIELEDGIITSDNNNNFNNISEKENYHKIKSKLPMLDAIKLGFKSLNKRKIKLLFTIILISFSTLFLLLAYIMNSYNVNENHLKLLIDNNIDTIEIKKYNYSKSGNSIYKVSTELNYKDVDSIKKDLDHDSYIIYSLRDESRLVKFFNLNVYVQEDLFNDPPEEEKNFYTWYTSKLQIIELNKKDDLIKEKIIGKFPNNNDEIMISNYIADFIIKNGIYEYNNNQIYYPKNYDELVNSNKNFSFGNNNSAKIVGVIEYDLSKYKYLKEKYNSSGNIKKEDFNLQYELLNLSDSVLNKIYTKVGFINNLKNNDVINLNSENQYVVTIDNKKLDNTVNTISNEIEYYNGIEWIKTAKLNKNEMLISLVDIFDKDEYSKYSEELNSYILKYPFQDTLKLEKEFVKEYINLNSYIGQKVDLKIYEDTTLYSKTFEKQPDVTYDNIKVVGITGLIYSETKDNLFSNDILSEYTSNYILIDGIFLRENNSDYIKKLINKFSYDSKYSIYTMYSTVVEGYNTHINSFKVYISIGMVVFLIFSMFLILNFMLNSVSNRKKDIGILKSLGAKDIDVIKIFISEGIFLSIISSFLSIIASILILNLLNMTTMDVSYSSINPYNINIKLVLVTFGYILIMVLLSSVIPLLKISKMKPIDAIYNR